MYRKKIGRIELELRAERDGGHAFLTIPDGWNKTVPTLRNELTREELRDLKYMIERALAAVDRSEA